MPELRKGVIFDLDGTLLNTISDLASAMNRALAVAGFAEHPLEDYYYYVGNGARELVKRSLPTDACNDENIQTVKDIFSEDYARNCDVTTAPYPGIIELLHQLARAEIPMSVLSNKPHRYMSNIHKQYFADFSFVCFYGQRDGIAHKPNPASALEVAAEMGLKPADILYVGDSCVDMQTAANAGMRSCGVLWGYRDRQELVDNGAEFIVDCADGIFQALETL